MKWLTGTQTRNDGMRRIVGWNRPYQGRYKAIPVQTDHHFWTVARYVQRDPVRAPAGPTD